MPSAPRKDSLGRVRQASQSTHLVKRSREGAFSRSHNINMPEAVHAAFAKLTPQERGDLIEQALQGKRPTP